MSTPPTPVPPPRREGRRFPIPTPADLRHPGQRRRSETADEAPERAAEVAGPDESDEQVAAAPGAGAQSPAPPEPAAPARGKDAPAAQPVSPPAARTSGPTPATLPRPGHKQGPPAVPEGEPASVPSPPAPRTGAEPITPEVAGPAPSDTAEAEDIAGQPGGTEQLVIDEADQAPSTAAAAGEAVRRMIPNPATLMAAGRGMRKVRPPGLRGRRLPKVEETSAGGVVLDLESDPPAVALIARHDRRSRLLWSLPKGHVEEGETPEQAALREVHEETGLLGRIVAPLGIIDFWFVVEDKRIHKTVHHYVIEAVGGELSDEDIEVEAVEWIPFNQVVRKLAYGDERRLVEKVAQIVPGVK